MSQNHNPRECWCGINHAVVFADPIITWTWRRGWYLLGNTSRVPRGWYALEYGLPTTTAARQLVAAIHPDEIDNIPNLYPEAIEVAAQRER